MCGFSGYCGTGLRRDGDRTLTNPPVARTVSKVLGYARRVAVVGLSPDPTRPSYGVARTLIARGYEVIPVNPNVNEVLGLASYPSLADVPGVIDIVDVFRREEHLETAAREAAAIEAKSLWLQLGLVSEEAAKIAAEAGMDFVENLCLAVEVRHFSPAE